MIIEALRCWHDRTWDTETIEIDGKISDFAILATDSLDTDAINNLVMEHYQACTGIVHACIYHVPVQEGIE